MIRYSVIIPFRDSRELLEKALRSIPDRTDIQVIVADDNEVPLQPASFYSYASLNWFAVDCHKGAGYARNCALNVVRGKYILFCDSDDYFTLGAFDVFDRYLDACNDITFFNVNSERLQGSGPAFRHWRKRIYLHRYLHGGGDDGLRYRWDAPWGKMYRTEFVRSGGYVFGETMVSNDDIFSVHTGHAASRIGVDSEHPVYVATIRNGSLSRTKTKECMFINYCVHVEKLAFLIEVGREDLCGWLWMHKLRALLMFGTREYKRYREYAEILNKN